MSKRGYISRYLLILKKLKLKPYSSYSELKSYLENQVGFLQMQDDSLNIGFSKRTLQRDIRDIRNVFGIDIEYSRSSKGYYISQNEMENMNFQRMMEAFDMFNSLNIAQDLSPHIHLERRRAQGTGNLYGLLHAIKNKRRISFSYQKFLDEDASIRSADPYALKEFRNRWYVLAKDLDDQGIKSFGLDRLTDLEITSATFEFPGALNIEARYRHSFGIVGPTGENPERIVLSLDPFQGKYIKTLPLHESQRIIKDGDDELRIELTLFVTHDLVMELLSLGCNMKVLEPEFLANLLRDEHQRAFNQYKEDRPE